MVATPKAKPLDLSTPYKCGYDCGKNMLCNANKGERFTDPADLGEWDRGYAAGRKAREAADA